ncbi:MAG: hypothetical protein ACK50L_01095 [Bacteroidota bacterium]|jgi:hypothetical protein
MMIITAGLTTHIPSHKIQRSGEFTTEIGETISMAIIAIAPI